MKTESKPEAKKPEPIDTAALKVLCREAPATESAIELLDQEIKRLTSELNPRLARRAELTKKLDAISKARAELTAGE